MGLKSGTLQMLPWWCLHLTLTTPTPTTPIRLIGSDGRVLLFRRRVHAAELMASNPSHLICHSNSFFIGRKLPALSPDEELLPGSSYFLLPIHFFHSVLSFVTVASSFAAAKPSIRPFDIHKTEAGALQIRVSDEFIKATEREMDSEGKVIKGSSRVCTTDALEKDYKQLVGRKGRQWKPELETIREFERRRGLWGRKGERGFLGFKRKKKVDLCV